MIEWIEVLTDTSSGNGSIAVVIAFAVLVNFARQALRQVKPKVVKKCQKKTQKRRNQR